MKKILEQFNITGGAILGLHSLVIIALSISSFVFSRDIPTTVVTLYSFSLGAFAVTSTIAKVRKN